MIKGSLLVTVPKTVPKEVILEEIKDAIANDFVYNHKLGKRKPKEKPDYIYIVHDGHVFLKGKLLRFENKEFRCETTNVLWEQSWYAVFTNIEILKDKIPMKGFQGFRYIK